MAPNHLPEAEAQRYPSSDEEVEGESSEENESQSESDVRTDLYQFNQFVNHNKKYYGFANQFVKHWAIDTLPNYSINNLRIDLCQFNRFFLLDLHFCYFFQKPAGSLNTGRFSGSSKNRPVRPVQSGSYTFPVN